MQTKSPAHGYRFPKAQVETGYSPGSSPGPARSRLRLALARCVTTNPPAQSFETGDRQEGGTSANLVGRRLATDKRHHADTGNETTGLTSSVGAGAGDGSAPDFMVPIVKRVCWEGVGGGGLSFALSVFGETDHA